MRAWKLLPLLIIGGCITSSWELADYTPPPLGAERLWFEDLDGDGWGAGPGLVSRREQAGWVRNDRDCDDDDPDVTAEIGPMCPTELVSGDQPNDLVGHRGGRAEFVAVLGATPTGSAPPAEAACRWWGLSGGLATFESMAEFAAVRDALDRVSDGPYAGWIGLESDGQDWAWQGDASVEIIDAIGWCQVNEPDPSLYVNAALVRTDGAWCLGVPSDAGASYGEFRAHFVCERPVPDPQDYRVFGLE